MSHGSHNMKITWRHLYTTTFTFDIPRSHCRLGTLLEKVIGSDAMRVCSIEASYLARNADSLSAKRKRHTETEVESLAGCAFPKGE